jgi:hypothetical protein
LLSLSKHKLVLGLSLGAAILAAPTAHAATAVCTGTAHRIVSPDAVRDSWQVVLRNAFSDDGQGHPGLEASVLISVDRGGSAPCFADYLIKNFQLSAAGEVIAEIQPTNRDYPVFFFDRITIDPTMIIDWRYMESETTLQYGNFAMRENRDPALMFGYDLSQNPLPPGWK